MYGVLLVLRNLYALYDTLTKINQESHSAVSIAAALPLYATIYPQIDSRV